MHFSFQAMYVFYYYTYEGKLPLHPPTPTPLWPPSIDKTLLDILSLNKVK